MSVPSDKLMELMKGSTGGASESVAPPPGMSEAESPPMASPMSTPEPKMGNKEAAMVNLGMAMDLIEQTLPAFGSESEEGQKALQALRSLTTILGPRKNKTNELQQSKLQQNKTKQNKLQQNKKQNKQNKTKQNKTKHKKAKAEIRQQ